MAIICKLVPSAMPEHVWMNRKREFGRNAGSLDHSQEPSRHGGSFSFGHEDVGACPLQWTQSPKLQSSEGMNALLTSFGAVDMQATMPEIDL
jgi:hypothetical protein